MLGALLATHFVQIALVAGALVAVLAGLLGPFVVTRGSAFAVHGIAELGLTGAAGGLLIGLDAATGALLGSLTVGLLLGVLGLRGRDRDTATGALLAAGLGLGVLFLSRLHAYATTGFGLLFGSITAVSDTQLQHLAIVAGAVLVVLAAAGRPLWFASVDPEAAAARGVPVRALAVLFMVLLAAAVAATIQVTGVLLVLTLMVTPAAAAQRLTTRPVRALAASVALALTSTVGGILASLVWDAPTSFFIAVLSFAGYLLARLAGLPRQRGRIDPQAARPGRDGRARQRRRAADGAGGAGGALMGTSSDDGSDDGGQRDGEQQPRAADEVADDLPADLVTGQQVVGAAPGDAEQQQQRQGRPGVGEHQRVDRRGDVVAPDPHPRGEQRPPAGARVRR